MHGGNLSEGVSLDEKLKLFVIDFLISEKKSIDYIAGVLKRYGLPANSEYTSLSDFIENYFSCTWNTKNKSWEPVSTQQLVIGSNRNYNRFINFIHNKENLLSYNDYIPYRSIRIPPGTELSEIDLLETAMSSLLEEKEINLDSNDASSLLKRVSAIESKLNEIARSINKISKVISNNIT